MYKHKFYIVTLLFVLALLSLNTIYAYPLQEPSVERKFDEDFKNRYDSETYNYEGESVTRNSNVEGIDGEPSEYTNDVPEDSTKNNSKSIDLSFLTWVFIAIFLLAVGFIVYNILGDGNKSFFTRGQLRKINNYEITAENIENADIPTLIKQAEESGNFRLAIRYNYLLLLKTLSYKNLITFEEDKTNNDYINELRKQPFGSSFQYISYLYNYIWYGEFLINKNQYHLAKDNFNNLINQVK